MARLEEFVHAGKQCYRQELEDSPPVKVRVWTTTMMYHGKPYIKEHRHWEGRHKLVIGENEYDVAWSKLGDGGKKLGIAVNYAKITDVPTTQEQLDQMAQRAIHIATQGMIRAGIW